MPPSLFCSISRIFHKVWTVNFWFFFPPRARVWSSTFFCLTCTGGDRCVFFHFFSPPPQTLFFIIICTPCSAVQRRGSGLFFSFFFRWAPRSSLNPREEKQPMCIPVFFPFSSCYISVCLCAHNKQNLLSIFTSPNNGICADELAGRAERFGFSSAFVFTRDLRLRKRCFISRGPDSFWHVQTIIPHVLFISRWQERLGFVVY